MRVDDDDEDGGDIAEREAEGTGEEGEEGEGARSSKQACWHCGAGSPGLCSLGCNSAQKKKSVPATAVELKIMRGSSIRINQKSWKH